MKYSTILMFLMPVNSFPISLDTVNEELIIENTLQQLKVKYEIDLTNINLSKIENKNVLLDNGYPTSNPSSFIYFVDNKKDELYVTKVIGKTETIGILNNFIVNHYDKKIGADFNDIGYDLRDKINQNLNISSILYIDKLSQNKPVTIPMGKINQYYFFMKYNNIDQFSNRNPQYVVKCNGTLNFLKIKNKIFIGYEYVDLKTPKFIGIKEKSKYIYIEGINLDNFMKNLNVKC